MVFIIKFITVGDEDVRRAVLTLQKRGGEFAVIRRFYMTHIDQTTNFHGQNHDQLFHLKVPSSNYRFGRCMRTHIDPPS